MASTPADIAAPQARRPSPRTGHRSRGRGGTAAIRAVSHSALAAYSLIVLLPLLFIIYLSVKDLPGIVGTPLSVPHSIQTRNYTQAWADGSLGRFLLNTVIVAVVSVAGILLFSTLAAFVIARYRFTGRQLLYLFFISGMALPVQIIALPVFILVKDIHLLNSLASLVLVYAAAGISFSVFLLVNFMRGIPDELQEAAVIDGAGPARICWHIVLPLVRPAFAIVAIFQFLAVWKEFLLPLILVQDPAKMTVGVGILSFVGEYGTQWDLLLAALAIVSIPSIVGFLLVARQFRRGLMSGGVKM
ncbi:MAG: carbohydrate ABC transporter permease [Gordonia sp. (in: high G+C Gram-positive bacteria)]